MAVGGYFPIIVTSSLILLGITLPVVISMTLSGERLNSEVTSTEAGLIVKSLSLAPLGMFFLNVTVHLLVVSDMLNFTLSPVTLLSSISKPPSLRALYHALSSP